ncbi:MAG: hypothetical protein Kow0025_11680 [Thermodesulfovibrionales bacterium]
MKVLVAYDGTLRSREALAYGIEKAAEAGGEVVALHVFDPCLFVGYEAGPGALGRARGEAMARAREAGAMLRGSGLRHRVIAAEGAPVETTLACAEAGGFDLLVCPPRLRSAARQFEKSLRRRGLDASAKEVLENGKKLALASVGAV